MDGMPRKRMLVNKQNYKIYNYMILMNYNELPKS